MGCVLPWCWPCVLQVHPVQPVDDLPRDRQPGWGGGSSLQGTQRYAVIEFSQGFILKRGPCIAMTLPILLTPPSLLPILTLPPSCLPYPIKVRDKVRRPLMRFSVPRYILRASYFVGAVGNKVSHPTQQAMVFFTHTLHTTTYTLHTTSPWSSFTLLLKRTTHTRPLSCRCAYPTADPDGHRPQRRVSHPVQLREG